MKKCLSERHKQNIFIWLFFVHILNFTIRQGKIKNNYIVFAKIVIGIDEIRNCITINN